MASKNKGRNNQGKQYRRKNVEPVGFLTWNDIEGCFDFNHSSKTWRRMKHYSKSL